MDLSTINFSVNTKPLEAAAAVIGELVTNVGKLDKAARDAAQTEATLARAAKLNADANLQNAKAQDTRLKSTITADKADQQAADAIERKTKATERASTAIKKNADMLQLQNDTYDFILEGFSKGDAKVLAMAKATGQLSDQLKQVLTDIRQFSKNTFDQTETGLDRMVKSAKEASSAQGFLNNGLNLTSKQAKELSNDLDRLNIRLQHQGKSYQEITKEQAIYKQRFVEEANAVNRATSALAAVEKQRKDVVSATNYLTQAEAKMAAALNLSNAALDKAGTDSLVKYETALRKSGVTQDLMTQKLATYKAQLAQVQEQEMKRREQHLTRAISPQLMDIGVSLYSGQNPLTVLIQQSGQLVDLFQLSGVEAGKLGEAMRKSFYSMVPAIATVTKELASLFFGMFVDAGRGITSFISNATGLNKVLQDTDDILYLIGGRVTWFSKILHTLGTIASVTFGTGVLAIVAGLAALAVGLKQVITENNDLAKAFALSGASIDLSHTQMIGYVKTLADSGATTGQATEALLAMAKAGNFTSSEILLVSDAAIQMQKGFGVAIEDTVKQFAKLKEKPVEALLEIAKSSGMVGPEVIKMVQELERAGKSTEAASVAMKAYANVTKQQVAQMKENYNGFALFMIDLGQKIKQFFSDTFKTLFLATDPNQQLEDQLVKLRERIKDVSATLESNKSWGISGDPKLLNSLKEQERMIISQIGAQVRLRGEEEKRKYLNAENAKYESAIADLRGNALDAIEKETRKTQTLAEFRKSFINDKLKEAAKEKSVDIEKLKLNTDLMNVLQQQADIEYKKTQKSGSKSENYFATLMREATNNTIAANTAAQELTKSEQKLLEVRSDPRFEKLTATQKQDVISKYEAAIAAEKQTALTEKLADAEERLLKLLGKSSGIGRQYYTDMANMEKDAALLGKSREEIEELTRAIFMATPAWKAYEKALEDVNSAARKFNEDSIASQAATLKENESLDYRLSLLGKTAEEQRALSIEYNRANKISEVRIKLAKQLRDIEADIEKAKKDGLPEEKYKNLIDAQVQARKDAAEQEKVINREVAVQSAEDLQKEFDAIKNGITDSLVTALFEGGEAGSKKVRDLVVAELRKPVTMMVNAVVNTILGNTVGSLMGGDGEEAAGSAGGSLLGSAAGSMLGGVGAFGIGASYGTTSLVANGLGATLSAGSSMIGAGSVMSGLGTIAGALGPIALGVTALASIISSLDDSGTLHTGGAASYSVATGQRNSLGFRDNEEGLPSYNPNDNIDYQFGTGFGWVAPGKETISAMETLSKSLVEIFDGIAKTFGKTAGYEVAVAFADDTSKDGAWGAFAVRLQGVEILNWEDFRQSRWAPKEFGDGEEGYKQYLAAVAKDTREVLTDMDIPGWAKTILNDIGENPSMEALSGAIQLLAQVETVFKSFGQYMPQFAILADSAKETLIRASGGVQALAGNMSSFVNAFYTDAEKLAINSNNLSEALFKLGFEMPKTREEFKALVQSQIELGDSGAESLAALLSLSGAMDAVLPAFGEVETAVVGMSDTLRGLTEEANSLEIEILRLQGKNPEADTRQRELDTSGFSKAEIAAYDYNQSLREQIRVLQQLNELQQQSTSLEIELLRAKGLTAEADARQRQLDTSGFSEAEIAAYDYNRTLREQIEVLQRLSQLQQQSTSLEIELLRAKGLTAEADVRQRELEISGMTAAQVALYDYNRALRGQIDSIRAAASALDGLSNIRFDLENQLLTAQGNTTEVDRRTRERDLAGLTEGLTAEQAAAVKQAYDYNNALRAQVRAQEEATAAANASAAAYFAVIDRADAERGFVNDAQSVLDSIYGSAQDASSSAASNAASAATATADAWKSAVSSIKSYLEKLRADTLALAPPSVRYSTAKGTFDDYVSKALSGDSEAALKLTDAADAFLESSLKSSVTRTDYIRDRMLADIKLSSVLETGEAQVSVQEAIASASNAAVSELRRVNDNLTGFAGDLARILRGGYGDASRDQANVVANSFAKMQADFDAYFNASTGWAAVGNTYTDAAFGDASFKKLDNNTAQFIGATGTIDYIRAGESLLDVAKRIPELRALWEQQYGIKLPALAVGTNYVPKDMPAMLHEGEAVVPKKFNPWVNTSSSNSSSDLVDEIRALRTEVQMLRAEARATAVNTGKTARVLDDVTQGGDAIKTVTA